jgi:hypothetical protein
MAHAHRQLLVPVHQIPVSMERSPRPERQVVMKKMLAVMLLCGCLCSVVSANQYNVMISFDPVDAFLGYLFAKGMNWAVDNWNNGQYWGNACTTYSCPPNGIGGGGGGAW